MPQDAGRGGSPPEGVEIRALAELALCESLAQTSGWAARWSAELAGADAALLWAPDALQPSFLCIAAFGAGTERALRRSVSRETGVVHDLVRDRKPLLLEAGLLAETDDPFLEVLPAGTMVCLLVPLQAERLVMGLLALAFDATPDRRVLENLQGFLRHATPALARALRAERKTTGLLAAIERLTNLYDVTKTFGSTIDLGELSTLIASKSADSPAARSRRSGCSTRRTARWRSPPRPSTTRTTCRPRTAASAARWWATSSPAGRSSAGTDSTPTTRSAAGIPDFPIRSILAVPLVEDETPLGAIVVVNKRGRHPEFTAADEELLVDIERQAVRALHNARQYEAEKKVQELDALLAVSREITSTLDLDKVMRTIVNATSALIRYDRCAIAILQRGRLRIGAVSGAAEVDRKDPSVQRTRGAPRVGLLRRRRTSPSRAARTARSRPTVRKPRRSSAPSSRRAAATPFTASFSRTTRESSASSASSATSRSSSTPERATSSRSSSTRPPSPSATPSSTSRSRSRASSGRSRSGRGSCGSSPASRVRRWALGSAAALVLLVLLPWNVRVAGPGPRRSRPADSRDGVRGRRSSRASSTARAMPWPRATSSRRFATTPTGPPPPRRAPPSRSPRPRSARHRAEGNAAATVPGSRPARRDASAGGSARRSGSNGTRLRAPEAGIVLTPRLDERVGQFLAAGAEFAVLAETSSLLVEVAVPGARRVPPCRRPEGRRQDELLSVPDVSRDASSHLGAVVREEGEERFVIAETRVENPGGLLKPGMLGTAKVSTGRRPHPRGAPPAPGALGWPRSSGPSCRERRRRVPAASPSSRPPAADGRRGARGPPRRPARAPGPPKGLVIRRQVQVGEVTLGRQASGDEQVLHVRRRRRGASSSSSTGRGRRTRDPRGVPRRVSGRPRSASTLDPRLRGDAPRGSTLLEQSAAEKNLQLLSKFKNRSGSGPPRRRPRASTSSSCSSRSSIRTGF